MVLTDTIAQKLFEKEGCQYIGPDQDPRLQDVKKCGHTVLPGKAYCKEHYAMMYQTGTAITKKKASAAAVAKKQHEWSPGELETLLWEAYEELIEEGEIEA